MTSHLLKSGDHTQAIPERIDLLAPLAKHRLRPRREPIRITVELPHPDDVNQWYAELAELRISMNGPDSNIPSGCWLGIETNGELLALARGHQPNRWAVPPGRIITVAMLRMIHRLEAVKTARTRGCDHNSAAVKEIWQATRNLATLTKLAVDTERQLKAARKQRKEMEHPL